MKDQMNILTPKQQAKLDAWKAWGNKMKFLREIHAEIAPKLKAKREAIEF